MKYLIFIFALTLMIQQSDEPVRFYLLNDCIEINSQNAVFDFEVELSKKKQNIWFRPRGMFGVVFLCNEKGERIQAQRRIDITFNSDINSEFILLKSGKKTKLSIRTNVLEQFELDKGVNYSLSLRYMNKLVNEDGKTKTLVETIDLGELHFKTCKLFLSWTGSIIKQEIE